MTELRVLIDEVEIGSVFQGAGGKLRFVYDEEWRNRIDAVPLSLSMPLAAKEHPHKVIEPYLWNLLPDREEALRQIAAEHDISPRNPFALVGARSARPPAGLRRAPPTRQRERKHGKIYLSHWQKTAAECRYDEDKAVQHVRDYIAALPAAAQRVMAEYRASGLALDTITLLIERLVERCEILHELYE